MTATFLVHKLTIAALLLAGAAQLGNASASPEAAGAESSVPVRDAASAPVSATPASPAPPGAGKPLSYAELMKMSPEARRELIDKMSSDEQSKFLFSLSDMQRAVLLFDPDDCSPMARLKRRAYATGKKADGFGEQVLKSSQGSLTRGILGFVPGGKQLIQAAEINEARIDAQKQISYVDVCDLPTDERAALLNPSSDSPATTPGKGNEQTPKATRSLFDRLTEVVTR